MKINDMSLNTLGDLSQACNCFCNLLIIVLNIHLQRVSQVLALSLQGPDIFIVSLLRAETG